MNLLLMIVAILMLCKMVSGSKTGMVKATISFVSLIIICVVVALIANGVSSYFDKKIVNVILVIFLLIMIGLIHYLLGLVFFSAKMIAKLPVVSWVDKVLGIIVGILETVLILWTVYTFVMLMNLGAVGQQIMIYTQESEILTWFYENNYLAHLLETISSEIHFSLFK